MTFATSKFRAFLPAATFAMAAEFLMGLSDSVICGHVIGETGLSAVNLMQGVFEIVPSPTQKSSSPIVIRLSDAAGVSVSAQSRLLASSYMNARTRRASGPQGSIRSVSPACFAISALFSCKKIIEIPFPVSVI